MKNNLKRVIVKCESDKSEPKKQIFTETKQGGPESTPLSLPKESDKSKK